jgi:hypothetical protein
MRGLFRPLEEYVDRSLLTVVSLFRRLIGLGVKIFFEFIYLLFVGRDVKVI